MNLTLQNMIYIIICIVEAMTVGQYFSSLYSRESDQRKQAASLLVSYSIVYLAMFLSGNSWVGFLMFFVVNYLAGHFFYEIPLKKSAVHALFLLGLLLLGHWIVSSAMRNLLILTAGNGNALGYHIFRLIFSRLLWLIFVEIAISVIEWRQEDKKTGIFWNVFALCAASAATCLGVSVLIYLELTQVVSGLKELLVIIGAVSMLLANVLIYWNSIHSRRRYKDYMDLQRQLEKESADAAYYSKLAAYSEEQKILIHDIRKHLNMMQEMTQAQQYDQIADYLQELLDAPGLQKTLRVSDNSMANLILTDYKERCKRSGIRLYLDIRSKSMDFLSTRELTALFSNLLANAMEAAMGVPEAFIDLRISLRTKTQVVIHMTNSCKEPPVTRSDGTFITRKTDAEKHGFGMRSIERILKAHNGMMNTHYEAKNKTFCTVLSMSVQQ